jgi:hypothetical protein
MGITALAVLIGAVGGALTRKIDVGGRAGHGKSLVWLWGIPLALALQLAWVLWLIQPAATYSLLRVVVPCSTFGLAVVLARNWAWPAARLLFIGVACNLAVIIANGGLMPVTPAVAGAVSRAQVGIPLGAPVPGSKDVLLEPDSVRLSALSDHFLLAVPGYHTVAMSFGDILILIGVAWWTGSIVSSRLPHQGETAWLG